MTMDRLKKITVEPDFDVWKEYAYKSGVHASILTYLELKKENFYKVETALDGKRFVTARGWEDLSQMIKLYEKHQITVNEKLTSQYLQNPEIARDFAAYYDLFHKYQSDCRIGDILEGHASKEIRDRARKARFDERLALLGLLLDAVTQDAKEILETQAVLTNYLELLKQVKGKMQTGSKSCQLPQLLSEERARITQRLDSSRTSHPLSSGKVRRLCRLNAILAEEESRLNQSDAPDFALLKEGLKTRAAANGQTAEAVSAKLEQLFLFCEEVFPSGQEPLILVTNLTVNETTASFIDQYGCPKYFEHNKELLFYERNQEILAKLETLEL